MLTKTSMFVKGQKQKIRCNDVGLLSNIRNQLLLLEFSVIKDCYQNALDTRGSKFRVVNAEGERILRRSLKKCKPKPSCIGT